MTEYERIGKGYSRQRRADPRIAEAIRAAVGDAQNVLNVGAGTGNYEPPDCIVIGLEPSALMIRQRNTGAGPAVCGVAERLPFADASFDVAMATLTLHHWADIAAGVKEMRRVSRRQVIFLFDIRHSHSFWLHEYYPEIASLPHEMRAPDADQVVALLGGGRVEVVPVPMDCIDGFGCAYWGRPEAYLQPEVQASMSCFAMLGDDSRAAGDRRLKLSLETGDWDDRHGYLRQLQSYDCGYRLVAN